MSFKLYEDKSSLDRKFSRQVSGGTSDTDGNFLSFWTKKEIPHDDINDIQLILTTEYEYRPDKIAKLVYDREDLQWLVLQYNNIVDIHDEFVAGAYIQLPQYERTFYEILV